MIGTAGYNGDLGDSDLLLNPTGGQLAEIQDALKRGNLKSAAFGSTDGSGQQVEFTGDLDLTNDADRAAALRAITGGASGVASAAELAQRLEDDGRLTFQVYDTTTSNTEAGLKVGLGAGAGVEGGQSSDERDLGGVVGARARLRLARAQLRAARVARGACLPGSVARPRRIWGDLELAEQIKSDVATAHEGGGPGPRRRAAARALRAAEGRQGRRRRRAGRAAARAQAPPRVGAAPTARRAATDLADAEAYEAGVIEAYLPAELSDAELDALVARAIAETGAAAPRDMGKAIKHVMAAAGGRADGKRVSTKVKEALD